MKKTYIAPSLEVLKVDTNNIIATSLTIDGSDDNAVDTSNGGQLGREDNTPSRPNIWEQGW